MTQLNAIAENIWAAEHDLYLPGGVHFRGRMTVVRLPSKNLVLHSPIPIDMSLAESINRLGTVKFIVAPNTFHHLHLRAAHNCYPNAKIFAPANLQKKEQGLPLHPLADGPSEIDSSLEYLHIQGASAIDEFVFFEKRSGTLIVTDLVFNIQDIKGFINHFILWLVRAHRRLAQSRSWFLFSRQKKKTRQSLETMLRWNFTRVIMAHGEIVTENAKEKMQSALWML